MKNREVRSKIVGFFFKVIMQIGIGFSTVPNLLTWEISYPRFSNSEEISSVEMSQGMPRITIFEELSSGKVLV